MMTGNEDNLLTTILNRLGVKSIDDLKPDKDKQTVLEALAIIAKLIILCFNDEIDCFDSESPKHG